MKFTDQLHPEGWQNLTNIPASGATRTETVNDPAAVSTRFYRLVIPAQP